MGPEWGSIGEGLEVEGDGPEDALAGAALGEHDEAAGLGIPGIVDLECELVGHGFDFGG